MWEVLATAFFSPIFFLLVRDEAEEDTKRTCKRLTRYYAMGHAILGTTNGIFTNPTHKVWEIYRSQRPGSLPS